MLPLYEILVEIHWQFSWKSHVNIVHPCLCNILYCHFAICLLTGFLPSHLLPLDSQVMHSESSIPNEKWSRVPVWAMHALLYTRTGPLFPGCCILSCFCVPGHSRTCNVASTMQDTWYLVRHMVACKAHSLLPGLQTSHIHMLNLLGGILCKKAMTPSTRTRLNGRLTEREVICL